MPENLLDFTYIGVTWFTTVMDSHSRGRSGSVTGYETIGYQTNQVGHTQIATDASSGSNYIIDFLRY